MLMPPIFFFRPTEKLRFRTLGAVGGTHRRVPLSPPCCTLPTKVHTKYNTDMQRFNSNKAVCERVRTGKPPYLFLPSSSNVTISAFQF